MLTNGGHSSSSNVAEITGRAKRMLKEADGSYKYVSRMTDDIANLDEVRTG